MGRRLAQAGRSAGPSDLFDRAYRQWADRYSTYVHRWFDSGGGGTWHPLADSTIRQRRSAEKNRRLKRRRKPGTAKTTTRGGATRATVKILKDTGILRAGLSIGAPGNLTRRLVDGVEFGFDQSRHLGGKLTMAKLAEIHDGGGPNLPARPILIDPDRRLIERMIDDVLRAFR